MKDRAGRCDGALPPRVVLACTRVCERAYTCVCALLWLPEMKQNSHMLFKGHLKYRIAELLLFSFDFLFFRLFVLFLFSTQEIKNLFETTLSGR